MEEPERVHIAIEIEALMAISAALDSLGSDTEAKSRVMRWACDRYELGELNP